MKKRTAPPATTYYLFQFESPSSSSIPVVTKRSKQGAWQGARVGASLPGVWVWLVLSVVLNHILSFFLGGDVATYVWWVVGLPWAAWAWRVEVVQGPCG